MCSNLWKCIDRPAVNDTIVFKLLLENSHSLKKQDDFFCASYNHRHFHPGGSHRTALTMPENDQKETAGIHPINAAANQYPKYGMQVAFLFAILEI